MKWELSDLPQIFSNFFNSPDTSNHEVGFGLLEGFNEKDVNTFAAKCYGVILSKGKKYKNNQWLKIANWKELLTLQWLNLTNNHLASLPTEIGNLGLLQSLYLGNNQLAALPTEIGNLGSLQRLYLDNNHLASLPTEIGNLGSLQWLDLGNNQLAALPTEIGNLGSLQRLDLSGNPISKAEQKRIKTLLPNCQIDF